MCPQIGETWVARSGARGDETVTFRVEFVSHDQRVFDGYSVGRKRSTRVIKAASHMLRRVK